MIGALFLIFMLCISFDLVVNTARTYQKQQNKKKLKKV